MDELARPGQSQVPLGGDLVVVGITLGDTHRRGVHDNRAVPLDDDLDATAGLGQRPGPSGAHRERADHRAIATNRNGVDTATLVPGIQYCSGRHISCRSSSHPHAPGWTGTVATLRCFSTSARRAFVVTAESNWTITGIPTPTVPPLGASE